MFRQEKSNGDFIRRSSRRFRETFRVPPSAPLFSLLQAGLQDLNDSSLLQHLDEFILR